MSRPKITYTLNVERETIDEAVLLQAMEKIAEDYDMIIPDIEMFVSGTPVDMDWYTEDEEHLFYPLSVQFPESLFVLELDDYYITDGNSQVYYKNGQRAELGGCIVYPPFSESMLDYDDEAPAVWSSPWVQGYRVKESPQEAPLYELRDLNRRLIARLDNDEMEQLKCRAQTAELLVDALRKSGFLTEDGPFDTAADYFDQMVELKNKTPANVLKWLPAGLKQEYLDLMHRGCMIAGKYYLLNSDVEKPRGRWTPPPEKPMDPERIFKKLHYSASAHKALYWSWKELGYKMDSLLSALLCREVKVEALREEFYYWEIRLNTPLLWEEVKLLLDIIEAELPLREETLLYEDDEDTTSIGKLPQKLCELLLSRILPFTLGNTLADENGIWLHSAVKGV